MKFPSAICSHPLDPSSSPAERTVLARFAGKVGPKPLVLVPISVALLSFPPAPHIPASHSYSDMISLDKHGMNFSQRVINYRKEFLVYEQRADGSPRESRNMRGFWPQVQPPQCPQLEITESCTGAWVRGSSCQPCIYTAIRKRKRRSTGPGANGTAAEALHLFPGSHYVWQPKQSMLHLTKATCSSPEVITARVQGKFILLEWLKKYPIKGKNKVHQTTKQKCSRIILSTGDLFDLNHRNLQ